MPDKVQKNIFKNILATLASVFRTGWKDLAGLWDYIRDPAQRQKILGDLWLFLKQFYKRVSKERITREAGSLTYITILGFVPFIVFIIMIAPDLPFLNLKDKIFGVISDNLMPTAALSVNNVIDGMLARRAGFNVMNFIVMIISSYSLFRVIRNSFDRILSMEAPKPMDVLSHIVRFLGTIILGVFIMIVLFSSSSLPLISRVLDMPLLRWLTYLVPFVMQFVLLIFLYMLMPTIKVSRSSLVRGAFWTAVIWTLVKSGFDFYIYRMTNYQAIYGALSALPIFLLWIYMNWLIILGGIVMASVFDNRKKPEPEKPDPTRKLRLILEVDADSRQADRIAKFVREEEYKLIVDKLKEEEEQEK